MRIPKYRLGLVSALSIFQITAYDEFNSDFALLKEFVQMKSDLPTSPIQNESEEEDESGPRITPRAGPMGRMGSGIRNFLFGPSSSIELTDEQLEDEEFLDTSNLQNDPTEFVLPSWNEEVSEIDDPDFKLEVPNGFDNVLNYGQQQKNGGLSGPFEQISNAKKNNLVCGGRILLHDPGWYQISKPFAEGMTDDGRQYYLKLGPEIMTYNSSVEYCHRLGERESEFANPPIFTASRLYCPSGSMEPVL